MKEGKWHGLEVHQNIKLKYNVSSKIQKGVEHWSFGWFLTDYKKLVFDKILEKDDYIVSKHNLLKNYEKISDYQMPHRNYSPRSN